MVGYLNVFGGLLVLKLSDRFARQTEGISMLRDVARTLRKSATRFWDQVFTFRVLSLHWIREDDQLKLVANPGKSTKYLAGLKITVRPIENGMFNYYLGENPSSLIYSSEQGAKLDAWQFAQTYRKTLFGSYRLRISA